MVYNKFELAFKNLYELTEEVDDMGYGDLSMSKKEQKDFIDLIRLCGNIADNYEQLINEFGE